MARFKEFYSIGEVSRICNVSRKAMRFYDQIGLIRPDKVGENNYRYYSREALLNLTILKYYKQMGFKLEEMRSLLDTEEYPVIEHGFRMKIDELEQEAIDLENKLTSVRDWYDLLMEAQTVIMNGSTEVSVKYVEPIDFGYMDQDYNPETKEAVINLDWTDYLDHIGSEITSAVVIEYPAYWQRMNDTCETMRIMQRVIRPNKKDKIISFGGRMMLSCYHIGSHRTIERTYQKMIDWAEEHGYKMCDASHERYVTDYWTTRNEDMFVTEILIEVKR